jgi:hypothetical protein
MSAGATLGSAVVVAQLADAMESSMGSNTESELSVPEKSYAGSATPESRYVSPMMSTDSPLMSNDTVYMRLNSQATETVGSEPMYFGTLYYFAHTLCAILPLC